MGKEWREFTLTKWTVAQSELHWNVVEPARREAAIEMSQPRNDHPDDGNFDVSPRLVEDEEIETRAPGNLDTGERLRAGIVERAEFRGCTL